MTRPQPRTGRLCSRVGCRHLATKTLTYIYSDSTAVLGPLATFSEPHAYDLCDQHSLRMSAPVGWTIIKHEPESVASGPTNDDLMAIADAVREVGSRESVVRTDLPDLNIPPLEIGRRGHLRAIPN
ncbi:Protein of unknown function DUF3499 [actinobacterium SCGC AAA044-D11]|uniref:Unannotated protein n=1 Tax=freshwater metagenome TaxID=449393 RepID=A0A6J6B9I0_9ZZZZ|nr:DUF3499 family protein [Actinomycetota bacterium]MTA24598.1 DUF3499 family protein [Actinomycetota bacterium]